MVACSGHNSGCKRYIYMAWGKFPETTHTSTHTHTPVSVEDSHFVSKVLLASSCFFPSVGRDWTWWGGLEDVGCSTTGGGWSPDDRESRLYISLVPRLTQKLLKGLVTLTKCPVCANSAHYVSSTQDYMAVSYRVVAYQAMHSWSKIWDNCNFHFQWSWNKDLLISGGQEFRRT